MREERGWTLRDLEAENTAREKALWSARAVSIEGAERRCMRGQQQPGSGGCCT